MCVVCVCWGIDMGQVVWGSYVHSGWPRPAEDSVWRPWNTPQCQKERSTV